MHFPNLQNELAPSIKIQFAIIQLHNFPSLMLQNIYAILLLFLLLYTTIIFIIIIFTLYSIIYIPSSHSASIHLGEINERQTDIHASIIFTGMCIVHTYTCHKCKCYAVAMNEHSRAVVYNALFDNAVCQQMSTCLVLKDNIQELSIRKILNSSW